MNRTAFPQFLRREQASQYLADVWGLSFTPGSIAKLCSLKRGPATHYDGRRALHTPESLDAFARSRIKGPVARLADPAELDATQHSTMPLHPHALVEQAAAPA